jgi:hypothetical protein
MLDHHHYATVELHNHQQEALHHQLQLLENQLDQGGSIKKRKKNNWKNLGIHPDWEDFKPFTVTEMRKDLNQKKSKEEEETKQWFLFMELK